MKKIVGFSLLGVTAITWILAVVLPFMGLSMAQLGMATTVIVIVGEGAFWLAIGLLGAQYWAGIKQRIKARFKKPLSSDKKAVAQAL